MLRGLKDLPAEERPRAGEQLNRLRKLLRRDRRALPAVKSRPESRPSKTSGSTSRFPGRVGAGKNSSADACDGRDHRCLLGHGIRDRPWSGHRGRLPQLRGPQHSQRSSSARYAGHLLRRPTELVANPYFAGQIRTMESRKPPLRSSSRAPFIDTTTTRPTRRCSIRSKASWSIGHITFADLKGVLTHLLQQIFSRIRGPLSAQFFSVHRAERRDRHPMFICGGKGAISEGQTCRVCKATGWLEILGAGMIDPASVSFCRLRSGEIFGIRFRHGRRANRHVEVRHRRYPAVFSERLEIFAAVRLENLTDGVLEYGVMGFRIQYSNTPSLQYSNSYEIHPQLVKRVRDV